MAGVSKGDSKDNVLNPTRSLPTLSAYLGSDNVGSPYVFSFRAFVIRFARLSVRHFWYKQRLVRMEERGERVGRLQGQVYNERERRDPFVLSKAATKTGRRLFEGIIVVGDERPKLQTDRRVGNQELLLESKAKFFPFCLSSPSLTREEFTISGRRQTTDARQPEIFRHRYLSIVVL
jgi:hypothetical protein